MLEEAINRVTGKAAEQRLTGMLMAKTPSLRERGRESSLFYVFGDTHRRGIKGLALARKPVDPL